MDSCFDGLVRQYHPAVICDAFEQTQNYFVRIISRNSKYSCILSTLNVLIRRVEAISGHDRLVRRNPVSFLLINERLGTHTHIIYDDGD